jgi:hypothetical protein
MTTTNPFVRIDDQIVEKLPGGRLAIGSIADYERRHGVKLDIKKVPYVSTGSTLTDIIMLECLAKSTNPNCFEELQVFYPFVRNN